MSILSDFHMHTEFSTDSETAMEDMVTAAINKGLKNICFTEHQDFGYPYNNEFPEGSWMLNVDSYLYELLCLREKYDKDIRLQFGIEVGMQETVAKDNYITVGGQMFDFVIASMHVVDGYDTYDKAYFEGRSEKEAILRYFEATLSNIKKFQDFDVLGHMDYIVRSLPSGESGYQVNDYTDYIDALLKFLIENEKGIEINTSPLRKGFANTNPHLDIIKRYRELGGEIITVGSDAHAPNDIAANFDVANDMLEAAGFKYYTIFDKRAAIPVKL